MQEKMEESILCLRCLQAKGHRKPIHQQRQRLTCPKCHGEMRIISFIDQPEVIKKILQHLGLWEDSHAPPERSPPGKELTFDPSYSQVI